MLSLEDLLVEPSDDANYTYILGLMTALGLPVTAWQAGDPTRVLTRGQAELLTIAQRLINNYVRAGFPQYAEGDWQAIGAEQLFGVNVPSASFATCTVRLTNAGGGVYPIAAGDLTFRHATSGKTYRNTSSGTLVGLSSLDVSVVADEAGSASSASVGEVSEIVTTLLGVSCSNTTVAVGRDKPTQAEVTKLCQEARGPLSPAGPSDAYSFVAKQEQFTGLTSITGARAFAGIGEAIVYLYVRTPGGPATVAEVAAVQNAVDKHALSLTTICQVASVATITVDVTATVYVYRSVGRAVSQMQLDAVAKLQGVLSALPIGGNVLPGQSSGFLFKAELVSALESLYPQVFQVVLGSPASDVALAQSQVGTLGVVALTFVYVDDP